VKVAHLRLDKLGLGRTLLLVDLEVTNDNAFPFAFQNSAMEMRIGGDRMLRGTVAEKVVIRGLGTTLVPFFIQLHLGGSTGTLLDLVFKPKEPFVMNLTTRMVSDNASVDSSQVKMEVRGTLDDVN